MTVESEERQVDCGCLQKVNAGLFACVNVNAGSCPVYEGECWVVSV
jgi:hypothetical protein